MSTIEVTVEGSFVVNKEIQILYYVSHQSVINKLTFRYQSFHFISLRLGFQFFLFHGARSNSWPGPLHYRTFTIILRHATLGRTFLDKRSARHRDLYLTTHYNQNRQTTMPPSGFEPTIPASERPQTHNILDDLCPQQTARPLGSAGSCYTRINLVHFGSIPVNGPIFS